MREGQIYVAAILGCLAQPIAQARPRTRRSARLPLEPFHRGDVGIARRERLEHRQGEPCRHRRRGFGDRPPEKLLRFRYAAELGRDRAAKVQHLRGVTDSLRLPLGFRQRLGPTPVSGEHCPIA